MRTIHPREYSAQTLLLIALQKDEKVIVSEFAKQHHISDASVSGALAGLAKRGIARKVGPHKGYWEAVDPKSVEVVYISGHVHAAGSGRRCKPLHHLYEAFGISMADIKLPTWGKHEMREAA